MALADLLKRPEIARVLGVEERTITNYQKLPKPIPTRRKARSVFYPLAPCVAWFVEYRVSEAVSAKDGPTELDVAKQRKEIASARKMELEVALLEESVMKVDVHEARLTERCEELAARVKGLNRYVAQIRGAQTEEEADAIAETMEDELLEALRGVADDVPDDDPTGPNGDDGSALAA